LASVRQIFECSTQLVNIKYKAPINLARLRHSTVSDQIAEFANRNANAGGGFRLAKSEDDRQRRQDVTQTAVHSFPQKKPPKGGKEASNLLVEIRLGHSRRP
jgi:hypothetical protein